MLFYTAPPSKTCYLCPFLLSSINYCWLLHQAPASCYYCTYLCVCSFFETRPDGVGGW
ncbi:hypothetical protein BD777DRAFT_122871 [Yarrowia lipolytica]|nr:hypothetical protein BD777DRAFT_122871 [Yarrowia lipolytica]